MDLPVLGVDFDNTLVCYDTVFGEVAEEEGMLASARGLTKHEVKRRFHDAGRYDDWTRLQGLVYGPHIDRAKPFPGARDFLLGARTAGWHVVLVSHKTRHPVLGDAWDLHAAAREWLSRQGWQELLEPFFELTLAAKLQRISRLGCQIFVDDLPEVLLHSEFPGQVQGWLFDPQDNHAGVFLSSRVTSWADAARRLAAW